MLITELLSFTNLPLAIQECFKSPAGEYLAADQITALDFSSCKLATLTSAEMESFIHLLKKCNHVKKLNLANNILMDFPVRHFVKIPEEQLIAPVPSYIDNPYYDEIKNEAEDEGYENSAPLQLSFPAEESCVFSILSAVNNNLQELDLSATIFIFANNFDSTFIMQLFNILKKFENLTQFKFNCNNVMGYHQDLFLDFIALICSLPRLESLTAYSGQVLDQRIFSKIDRTPEFVAMLNAHPSLKEMRLAKVHDETDCSRLPIPQGFRLLKTSSPTEEMCYLEITKDIKPQIQLDLTKGCA